MDYPEDLTAQQRAALVMRFLYEGERLRTVDIAEKLGMTTQGAWMMMRRIGRVIGELRLGEEGRWELCPIDVINPSDKEFVNAPVLN